MSAISPDAQHALTEKRGKELDRWIMMKCVRFMNGIEPFSPTLSDLPTEIINQVVKKMKPIDRLRARKVCRSLRTAVDKIGLRFDYIQLYLMKDEVEIWWSGTQIIYNTAENGSSCVIHNGQKKIIDGENFVERAAKDFKILSKHAQSITIANNTENRLDIVTTFMEILKSEKWILVKALQLWHFHFDEIFTILPCFEAKLLKKIELRWMKSIDRFERITQLEQWKNAKVVKIHDSNIASTMIVHCFHFKRFTISQTDEFPAQAAIQMRDDLLRRSTFQSCEVRFDKTLSNPIEIAKVFKPDYAGGNEFKIEFSNCNNKFDISLRKFDPNHFEDLSNIFELKVKRL